MQTTATSAHPAGTTHDLPRRSANSTQAGAAQKLTLAAKQREVSAQAQVIGQVELAERRAGSGCDVGLGRRAAVVDQHAEEVVLRLIEAVDAGGKAVGTRVQMGVGLAACVVRGLVPRGGHGVVRGGRVVVGLVQMIEGRNGEQSLG